MGSGVPGAPTSAPFIPGAPPAVVPSAPPPPPLPSSPQPPPAVPVEATPEYRYLFADLMTFAVNYELPLQKVDFTCKMIDSGLLNATVPVGGPQLANTGWQFALQPYKTAVFVDRDGTLQWGGILTKVRRRKSQHNVVIQAAEFPAYFDRRFQTTDISWTNADQTQMFYDIVTQAMAKSGGNVPIAVPAVGSAGMPLSGVSRTQTLTGDQFMNIGQQMRDWAAAVNGFDFAVDVAYAGTPPVPTATLRLGYPRRGRAAATSGLIFALPGNILDVDDPQDGTTLATTIYDVGAGSGASMLRSTASNANLTAAGYPLLETVTHYKDVNDQAVLDALAASDVRLLSQVNEQPLIDVKPDTDPTLGTFIAGDEARFLLMDNELWPTPPGLDINWRIVGYQVFPPDTVAGTRERVRLMLGPVWM